MLMDNEKDKENWERIKMVDNERKRRKMRKGRRSWITSRKKSILFIYLYVGYLTTLSVDRLHSV
jgi:hypothetical protein